MSNKLKVRNLIIGSGMTKICVPIVGKTRAEILKQADKVLKLNPDLIEWRADYYEFFDELNMSAILTELREMFGEIPIIFTFRTKEEGGEKSVSDEKYAQLLITIAKMNTADLIDLEMLSKPDVAAKIRSVLKYTETKILGSYHNFKRTPPKNEIISKLNEMEKMGADVCKIAVTPQRMSDVDVLLKATREFYNKSNVPVITMSMGELGAVSRLSGATSGSAVTFASGIVSSAPGQMNINQMRNIMNTIWQVHIDYNVMLIGFMGAGKTTVSSSLRKMTGLEEIDMDQYIVKKESMSISRMFQIYGEEYFRDKETEALREIQDSQGKLVSCGGGVVLRDENVAIMKKSGIIILLTATPETTYERVRHSTSRPILNGNMNVEHISQLMDKRKERYLEVADIIVTTDDKSIVDICEEILVKLQEYEKTVEISTELL